MNDPTKIIVAHGKVIASSLAKLINQASKGKITPTHITITSLLGHIPAAWALYNCRPTLAAGLIIVFGLMDALDGALAREQGTESKAGMFLDATTDRLKEIMLYSGLAVYAARHFPEVAPWMIVAVAGSSLLVSYVKAKGEMAVSVKSHNRQELNRIFSGGIARYEIRMFLLIIGLLTGVLNPILRLILALNLSTAVFRFIDIYKILRTEDKKTNKNAKN